VSAGSEVNADAHAYAVEGATYKNGIVCYHFGKQGQIEQDCRKFLEEQTEQVCIQLAYIGICVHQPLDGLVHSGASFHVCMDETVGTKGL
jgi:hypothetical protein